MKFIIIEEPLVQHAGLRSPNPAADAKPLPPAFMPYGWCVVLDLGVSAFAYVVLGLIVRAAGATLPHHIELAVFGVASPVFGLLSTAFFVTMERNLRVHRVRSAASPIRAA